MFTALYNTDDNCLIAAPTGSGKTACAEFAVLRMIQRAAAEKGAARCVYIAPLPALAKERLADWTAKVRGAWPCLLFRCLGWHCKACHILLHTPHTSRAQGGTAG